MQEEQGNTRRNKPPVEIQKRGIGHDVIVPILQEAKPIAEGTLAGLAVHKLTQGKNPPPDKKDN